MDTSKWLAAGFTASYRFVRVSRADWREVVELKGMSADTLSITRDDDSETKESGSVDYVGRLDIGSDYMRVYLDAAFHDGTAATVALGTFMVNMPSRRAVWTMSRGTAELDGLLRIAAESQYERPITVEAGSNAVDMAAKVLTECGLRVVAEPSDYKVGAARTYGTDGSQDYSKLDMVNDLLSLASYRGAWTDGDGTVHLTRDRCGEFVVPAWEFIEGENARFLMEVSDETDVSSVKNLVRVTYSTQERSFIGIAMDDDPGSRFSTVSMGRIIAKTERLSDVPDGATDQQIQQLAESRARELLEGSQSVRREVKLTSAHCPAWYGDRVAVYYPNAGIIGYFDVVRTNLRDIHGAMTEFTLRGYER